MEGDNANNWHIMSLCLFRNRGLKKKKPQMNTNYNETQVDVDSSTLTWYIKCDRYAIQKKPYKKNFEKIRCTIPVGRRTYKKTSELNQFTKNIHIENSRNLYHIKTERPVNLWYARPFYSSLKTYRKTIDAKSTRACRI